MTHEEFKQGYIEMYYTYAHWRYAARVFQHEVPTGYTLLQNARLQEADRRALDNIIIKSASPSRRHVHQRMTLQCFIELAQSLSEYAVSYYLTKSMNPQVGHADYLRLLFRSFIHYFAFTDDVKRRQEFITISWAQTAEVT